MTRRATIGENPLDVLIPSKKAARERREGTPKEPPSKRPGPRVEPPTGSKSRHTFHLPNALMDEVKDAVVTLSGPPARLTLAAFAESAFRRELERTKKEHNKGNAFPRRSGELRGGRPIKL